MDPPNAALQLLERPEDGTAHTNGSLDASKGDAETAVPEDDYDPHRHRKTTNPTNNWETLVHLLKCSLGTGILAMPQAFARAGLVTGILATIVVGILVTHCLQVLVRSQYLICKSKRVPLVSYPEAMHAALSAFPAPLATLARPAALAVDVFLVVYQLGICCVYIVFIAESIKTITDPYYAMPVEAHMGIILLPLLAFNCIRDLKVLAPWSTVANVLTLAGLAVVVYYLLASDPKEGEIDLWGTAAAFPLFFGTTLFALTAVGVVVALENNMATPAAFLAPCGVLNTGMAIIVLLYVLVGSLGYRSCRAHCSDSVTLDLPQGDVLATTVKALFAVAIFISYGLQCYVPVEIVWRSVVLPRLTPPAPAPPVSPRRQLYAEYALRLVLCLLTFGIAALVPRLGLFISLFGALCLSALGLCFPALLEALVHRDWTGPLRRRWRLLKDVLLGLVGLFGLVVGTYTALLAIVRSFSQQTA